MTDLITRSKRRPVVQRHSSFEHALLGDTKPENLVDAVKNKFHGQHLLFEERDRMFFFDNNGIDADPRQRFPQIHWHQLKASKLWLSYGELNALGDYLPDPETIDTMPHKEIARVLSLVRSNIAISDWNAVVPDLKKGGTLSGAMEVKALEKATRQFGVNSYEGLLSRNACHFAPFSWERWAQFHTEARGEALAHFRKKGAKAAAQNVAADAEEHERQAWLKNGFGDHFLQDSFAAGHLVNKTLVMQWFNEYLGNIVMSAKDQPNIAGQSIYAQGPTSLTHAQNRAATDTITDPQSAQERGSKGARIVGSGVAASGGRTQEQNYQAYTGFLDRTHLQLAAGALHDWFNAKGLVVQNGEQSLQFAVGGDDTLLTESGPVGVYMASMAAQSSQRAIRELLSTGQTEVTPELILGLVPQWVVPKGEEPISLKEWNEQTLRTLCFKKVFPEVVDKWNSNASLGSFFSPRTTDAGSSVDETKQTKTLIELTTPHL